MKAPSQADLAMAIEHIVYEYVMFKFSSNLWLNDITSTRREKGLTDIILESSIFHLRNLIEFFGKKPRENYINITDFGISGQNLLNSLNPYLGKINEQVSHLTYGRQNKEERWQDLIPIFTQELDNAWNQFVGQLSTDFQELFNKEISNRQSKCNRMGPTLGGATGGNFPPGSIGK